MARSIRHALLVGLLGVTLLSAGCSRAAPSTSSAGQPLTATAAGPTAVQVAQVKQGALSSTLSYPGNVQAKQQVSIAPKVTARVTKLRVDVGSVVKAGEVLVELDNDTLAAQVAQAEAGLAAAEAKLAGLEAGPRPENVAQATAALEIAKLKLADVEAGGRPEQVAQAEANLTAAQARLKLLTDGPTAEQRREALMNVEGAKAKLNSANVQKDGDCNPAYHPAYVCQASQAAVVAAAHSVDAAQAQHDALVAPPSAAALDQAQAAVDQAKAAWELAKSPNSRAAIDQARQAVAQAEAQLSLARSPVQASDLKAGQAAVDQAKAAVDLAKAAFAEATIRAPFDGIVAQRLVSEGTIAGPSTPVVTLISNEAEVVINVEEGNLASLGLGGQARLTANAYPGKEITATVTSVGPSIDAKSRTVQVRLLPTAGDVRLRDGMFAQVLLPVGGDENALLVPSQAMLRESDGAVVYVVDGSRVQRRAVAIGRSDGEQVEIREGVAEGERVVVSGVSGLKDGQEVVVQ